MCEVSFKLKELLVFAPLLGYPHFREGSSFILETGASGVAILLFFLQDGQDARIPTSTWAQLGSPTGFSMALFSHIVDIFSRMVCDMVAACLIGLWSSVSMVCRTTFQLGIIQCKDVTKFFK